MRNIEYVVSIKKPNTKEEKGKFYRISELIDYIENAPLESKIEIKKQKLNDSKSLFTPENERKFEKIFKKLNKRFDPMRKAAEDSERITHDDLATRINY